MLWSFLLALFSVETSVSSQTDVFSIDSDNWTSCESFLNNTVLDPAKVVDVDWKIFYFWSPEYEETYNIRFSLPSKVLVDRYRVELDKEVKPPVNWTDAALFMETSIDFSALLIKTPMSGLFRLIPSTAFDYPDVPILIFALKYVKPGYLGISNCRHKFCYALAPVDKLPPYLELEKAAATLDFYSEYNRSHIYIKPLTMGEASHPFHEDEDDEEDVDLDVDADPNRLEFF